MDLQEVANLSIESSVSDFCKLPPPDIGLIEKTDAETLHKLTQSFARQWVSLVVGGLELPDDSISSVEDGNANVGSDETIRDRVLLTLGHYYDSAVRRLLELDRSHPEFRAIAGVHDNTFFLLADCELPEDVTPKEGWAFDLTFSYFMGLRTSAYLADIRRIDKLPQEQFQTVEYMPQRAIRVMVDLMAQAPSQSNYLLAFQLLRTSVQYLDEIYLEKWDQAKTGHKTGIFSQMRLNELSLIAIRDPSVIEKYGVHHLDKLFENQLSLIFQSFGYYVASAKIGERIVDLICISAASDPKMSFWIEAKTSSKSYSLPSKDERAIVDYISSFNSRSSSSIIPPLAFVLIVGSEPSDRLASKLQKLETRLQIPIRFCRAYDIAHLREKILGPIPFDIFQGTVLDAPSVMVQGCFGEIVDWMDRKKERYESFVKEELLY
jgi:hypothetical protein